MTIKISKRDIENYLREQFRKTGKAISKKDFSKDGIPSYNTCLRLGISLSKLNNDFLLESYRENPKICKHCLLPMDYSKRDNIFCSHSCSASFNNLKEKDFNSCEICFETCSEKYCSRQCSSQAVYFSGFFNWLFIGRSSVKNPTLRKYLSDIDGYKCGVCGISEWNGKPITLEVDHIDGRSEDNSPDNVRLVCPNCHSQTATYKGRNRGKGRHSRRERYSLGKSY